MNILRGSLEPVLGPMRCKSCGRAVVWGVAVHVLLEEDLVRRRDLYDFFAETPHRCAAARVQAAA
jgi:hypothetical protein